MEVRKPDFSKAPQIQVDELKVAAQSGQITLAGSLALPEGWKINPIAPMKGWVELTGDAGVIAAAAVGEKKIHPPTAEFSISLPVEKPGKTTLRLSLVYYYCQKGGEGLCKVGNVVWNIPVVVEPTGASGKIPLKFEVKE